MSRDDEAERTPARSSPSRELVGYGHPPLEHRFTKGKSGNPKGRPKRPKVPKSKSLNFGLQPANELLIQEAYRTVTLKEGEQTITLPAIQAVFRAMGISALKGNRFAQRTITELVQQVENADRKLRVDLLETMIDYKVNWERAIEEAEQRGLPVPEPIPHPDDIVVDLNTGQARVHGPWTKEEKLVWDKQLQRRSEAQDEVTQAMAEHRKARSPAKKAMWLQEAHFEQKIFDIINDNLPVRYRTQLKGRSWAEGATRAGSQKRASWPGESD